MQPTIKPNPLHLMREYNQQNIRKNIPQPFILNISLISNPFLKDQQMYKYLVHMLNLYNQRVTNNQVKDQYQKMVYENLQIILADLAQISQKKDQISRLIQTYKWFHQQNKLLIQRIQQGPIRYKVDKQLRNMNMNMNMNENPQEPEKLQIIKENPSEMVQRIMGPYYKKSRTMHQQLQLPQKRIKEYKRKMINIAPFVEKTQEKHIPKILYPKPPPIVQLKEYDAEQNKESLNPQVPQQPIVQLKDPNQQVKVQEDTDKKPEQQDLGGFGEEPQQPQDQEPNQQEDQGKLNPKIKAFVNPVDYRNQQKKQIKEEFMLYKGLNNKAERSMEIRYIKMQQESLQKNKQEKQLIELAHKWGIKKSKAEKQLQKKLQNMILKPKYSFCLEQQPKIQRLSLKDEAKYGFTVPIKKIPKNPEVDISQLKLPTINGFNDKSIRKNRLIELKSKFGKMLNLSQYEERQPSGSLCQYVTRKRTSLAQIMRDHSRSKQRLMQIDEVTRIKQKLKGTKITINMNEISKGICLPQDEQKPQQMKFPQSSLPNNPFWVEPAKKKKKK